MISKFWHVLHQRRRQADVLHNIATPLTNIMLDLEKIDQQAVGSVDVRPTLSQMDKITKLIRHRDLLSCQQQDFAPAAIIDTILDTYQKPYTVHCRWSHAAAHKLTLFGSPDLFEQIVIHLLNNAAEAYIHNRTQREITINLISAMDGVNLLIGDNGRGITLWQRLWCCYPSVSYKKVKSGLGLYQVTKLLKKEFNGHLKIISLPHKGTLVVAHFPLN